MRRVHYFQRILAVLLSLSLSLPGPALALRGQNVAERRGAKSGLEELEEAVRSSVESASRSRIGMEEIPEAKPYLDILAGRVSGDKYNALASLEKWVIVPFREVGDTRIEGFIPEMSRLLREDTDGEIRELAGRELQLIGKGTPEVLEAFRVALLGDSKDSLSRISDEGLRLQLVSYLEDFEWRGMEPIGQVSGLLREVAADSSQTPRVQGSAKSLVEMYRDLLKVRSEMLDFSSAPSARAEALNELRVALGSPGVLINTFTGKVLEEGEVDSVLQGWARHRWILEEAAEGEPDPDQAFRLLEILFQLTQMHPPGALRQRAGTSFLELLGKVEGRFPSAPEGRRELRLLASIKSFRSSVGSSSAGHEEETSEGRQELVIWNNIMDWGMMGPGIVRMQDKVTGQTQEFRRIGEDGVWISGPLLRRVSEESIAWRVVLTDDKGKNEVQLNLWLTDPSGGPRIRQVFPVVPGVSGKAIVAPRFTIAPAPESQGKESEKELWELWIHGTKGELEGVPALEIVKHRGGWLLRKKTSSPGKVFFSVEGIEQIRQKLPLGITYSVEAGERLELPVQRLQEPGGENPRLYLRHGGFVEFSADPSASPGVIVKVGKAGVGGATSTLSPGSSVFPRFNPPSVAPPSIFRSQELPSVEILLDPTGKMIYAENVTINPQLISLAHRDVVRLVASGMEEGSKVRQVYKILRDPDERALLKEAVAHLAEQIDQLSPGQPVVRVGFVPGSGYWARLLLEFQWKARLSQRPMDFFDVEEPEQIGRLAALGENFFLLDDTVHNGTAMAQAYQRLTGAGIPEGKIVPAVLLASIALERQKKMLNLPQFKELFEAMPPAHDWIRRLLIGKAGDTSFILRFPTWHKVRALAKGVDLEEVRFILSKAGFRSREIAAIEKTAAQGGLSAVDSYLQEKLPGELSHLVGPAAGLEESRLGKRILSWGALVLLGAGIFGGGYYSFKQTFKAHFSQKSNQEALQPEPAVPLSRPRPVESKVKIQPYAELQKNVDFPIPPKEELQGMLQRFAQELQGTGFREFSPNDFDHGHLIYAVPLAVSRGERAANPGEVRLVAILYHTYESLENLDAVKDKRSWLQLYRPGEPQPPEPAIKYVDVDRQERSKTLKDLFEQVGTVAEETLSPAALSLSPEEKLADRGRYSAYLSFAPVDISELPSPPNEEDSIIQVVLPDGRTVHLVVSYENALMGGAGLEEGAVHVNLWGARRIQKYLDRLPALSSLSDQARHQLANEIVRERPWWNPYEDRKDFIRRLKGKVPNVKQDHLVAIGDAIGDDGFRFTRRALGAGVASVGAGALAAYFGIRRASQESEEPPHAVSTVPQKIKLESEVQEVVNQVAAHPGRGGVIIHRQTHVGGDAQEALDFIQAVAQQVGHKRVLVVGEAGAPSYREMGERLGVLLIPDKRMRSRIREYFVHGGKLPLPLDLIFPDPLERADWERRFEEASRDWQEKWRTLRLQAEDENASFSATLSRGLAEAKIDHVWEVTQLPSWILKAIHIFSIRAAERELYEKGNEETYFFELQDHLDFVGWMIQQRDHDLARQLERLMKEYPDRIIIVERGASHDEVEDAIEYGEVLHAVSRGYGASPGELVPTLEFERDRRHEGRMGQAFRPEDYRLMRKYTTATLLEILMEDGNRVQSGKQWSQAMQQVIPLIPDESARALNQAVFEQIRRPNGIGSLPYLEMRKAQTYFIYAWLKDRGLIPDSYRALLPPEIQDLTMEKWEEIIRGYLSRAGMEEAPYSVILRQIDPSGKRWEVLSERKKAPGDRPFYFEVGDGSDPEFLERLAGDPVQQKRFLYLYSRVYGGDSGQRVLERILQGGRAAEPSSDTVVGLLFDQEKGVLVGIYHIHLPGIASPPFIVLVVVDDGKRLDEWGDPLPTDHPWYSPPTGFSYRGTGAADLLYEYMKRRVAARVPENYKKGDEPLFEGRIARKEVLDRKRAEGEVVVEPETFIGTVEERKRALGMQSVARVTPYSHEAAGMEEPVVFEGLTALRPDGTIQVATELFSSELILFGLEEGRSRLVVPEAVLGSAGRVYLGPGIQLAPEVTQKLRGQLGYLPDDPAESRQVLAGARDARVVLLDVPHGEEDNWVLAGVPIINLPSSAATELTVSQLAGLEQAARQQGIVRINRVFKREWKDPVDVFDLAA